LPKGLVLAAAHKGDHVFFRVRRAVGDAPAVRIDDVLRKEGPSVRERASDGREAAVVPRDRPCHEGHVEEVAGLRAGLRRVPQRHRARARDDLRLEKDDHPRRAGPAGGRAAR